jgi:Domain of unknown function (DUF5753)
VDLAEDAGMGVTEAVIRRLVGGTEVMREQLRHMADAAQQGKTTILGEQAWSSARFQV